MCILGGALACEYQLWLLARPLLQCFFCSTLPVGRVSFTCDQLVENIVSATDQVSSRMASDIIQSIHVKMSDSIALPILNRLPSGPTMIDISAQPTVRSKRSRPVDDGLASSITEAAEETLPVKKKVKRTKVLTKLSTKRVRGSVVVKKPHIRRRQKR